MVSFDSEWAKGARVDASLPADQNAILSYQVTIFNRANGKTCTIIIYLESGEKRKRWTLRMLVEQAMAWAHAEGVIDAWPERIAFGGFFLRADLSTLRDFNKLKRAIDSMRGTYATSTRPIVCRSGRRKTSITFVDAMLLAPAGPSLKSNGASIGVEKIELATGAWLSASPKRYGIGGKRDKDH
jgi:hypothetical protein